MKHKSKVAVITAILLIFAMMPIASFAAEDAVAKIGSKTYPTLQEAVDAADDGDIVVLLKDVTEGVTIDDQGQAMSFTLDLNGKSINYEGAPGAVYVTDVGKLTIKNGTILSGSADYAAVTVEYGNIFFENVTVSQVDNANYYPAIQNNGGKVTLKSGTFSAASGYTSAIGTSYGAITKIDTASTASTVNWQLSGNFTVTVSGSPEAAIGKINYVTLDAAIKAVKNGQTITIQKDIETYNIFISDPLKSFTLDLNGKTITGIGDPNVIDIAQIKNLTVKNGTVKTTDVVNSTPISIAAGTVTLENIVAEPLADSAHREAGNALWVRDTGKAIIKSGNFSGNEAEGSTAAAIYTSSGGSVVLDPFSLADPSDNWLTAHSFKVQYGPAKVTGLKVVSRTTTANKLSWNAASNSDGYRIYVYGPTGKFVKAQDTVTNSGTVSGLKSGLAYSFKVRGIKTVNSEQLLGAYSSEVDSCTLPAKVTIKKLATGKTHYVKASWKDTTCSKYEVKIATNSKFTKGVKTYRLTDTSKKFTKLKKGKKYYVKVRAYTMMGSKKYYGAYSIVKSIKCK